MKQKYYKSLHKVVFENECLEITADLKLNLYGAFIPAAILAIVGAYQYFYAGADFEFFIVLELFAAFFFYLGLRILKSSNYLFYDVKNNRVSLHEIYPHSEFSFEGTKDNTDMHVYLYGGEQEVLEYLVMLVLNVKGFERKYVLHSEYFSSNENRADSLDRAKTKAEEWAQKLRLETKEFVV